MNKDPETSETIKTLTLQNKFNDLLNVVVKDIVEFDDISIGKYFVDATQLMEKVIDSIENYSMVNNEKFLQSYENLENSDFMRIGVFSECMGNLVNY